MVDLGPQDAEVSILTFKEGLLSPLAHDLRLAVRAFEIHVDAEAGTVEATFDPSSLAVVTAVRDERDDPGALSDKDKRTIEETIAGEVLHARRHPQIRFVSSEVTREAVLGTLALHGVERPVRVAYRREDGRITAEARLHQPDFGIRPYRAMLGTLKVQADVVVRAAFAL